MDKCSSFHQIDEQICSSDMELLPREDIKTQLDKFINDSNSMQDAYDAFFQLYHCVIDTDKDVHWMFGPISSAVERYGFVFSHTNYKYDDSLSTADHVLLLISRMLIKSLSARGMQVLTLLADEHILDYTNGPVLSLCSRSLCSLFVSTEVEVKIVKSFSAWLSKIASLAQWDPSVLSSFLSHWSEEHLPKTYWVSLDLLVSSFEAPFVTCFFLPLLEAKPSKSVIKQLTASCPSLSYDLVLLILRVFSPMNRELFSVWLDCVSSLLHTSSVEIDWKALMDVMICYLLHERSLSLLYRQKCVNCLGSVMAVHWKNTYDASQLISLLVSLFQSQNDRLIQKALEIVSCLHLSSDQEETVRTSICIVYRFLLQRDFEAGASVSSMRLKCVDALKELNIEFASLVKWILLPLQSFSMVIRKQSDVIELIQVSLKDGFDYEHLFRINEPNWNEIACSGIQLGLSKSHNLRLREVVAHRLEDTSQSEEIIYLLLCACESIALHPPLSILDRIISFPCSSQTEILLNQFCRVVDPASPSLKDYLLPVLERASHSVLSLSLSPALRLLESFPFSYLQESLVSLSVDMSDDRKILQVLRLLRIINEKSYELNKRAAQQIRQENDLDEEIRENTTQATHENMLNVKVCLLFDVEFLSTLWNTVMLHAAFIVGNERRVSL